MDLKYFSDMHIQNNNVFQLDVNYKILTICLYALF